MNNSKDRGSDVSVHYGVQLWFFLARGRLSSGQTEFLGLLSVRVGRYLIFFFLASPKRACHQTICCAFLLTSSSLQNQNDSFCSFFCGALQTQVIPRKKIIRTKKEILRFFICKLTQVRFEMRTFFTYSIHKPCQFPPLVRSCQSTKHSVEFLI